MPKLTEERREWRREQILHAALRCFLRNGMERTSVADITAESGLSAGSIYSHFHNKAELVQAAAQDVIERRVTTMAEFAASAHPPSPEQLLRHLASAIDPADARIGLQVWGQATTDRAMRDIVVAMTVRLRDAIALSCESWLVKVVDEEPGVARARALDQARQLTAAYQALLIRSALFDEPGASDEATIAGPTKALR